MREMPILHHILHACGRGAVRLFRQNVGRAWVSSVVEQIKRAGLIHVEPGDVVLRQARPFVAGVPGMSDLGGWKSVIVSADMVGQRVAIYVALEVKTETGRVKEEQRNFIAVVQAAGGIAGVVRSEGDAERVLADER